MEADQTKLALNARYGKRSGPLFIVKCGRCRIGQLLALVEAKAWLDEHQKLHDNKRKEGQAF